MNDIFNIMQPQAEQPAAWAHVEQSGLCQYFSRYYLQKAIAVFDFDNIPDTWDADYFKLGLFAFGRMGVLRTDKFGVICQIGAPTGYNVYYRPSGMIYASPFFNSRQLTIGKDTAVIRLMPDWGGVLDIVSNYAQLAALVVSGAGQNLINSKAAYVFSAENDRLAESFKELYSRVASGQPAVVSGKRMFTEDGKPLWQTWTNNLRQNFITPDLLECLRTLDAMFDASVGLPNANTGKKERLNTEEVHVTDDSTFAKSDLWLSTMKRTMSECNKLFGTNLNVKYHFKRGDDGVYQDDTAGRV